MMKLLAFRKEWGALAPGVGDLRDVDPSRKGGTSGFQARETVCPATDRGGSQKGRSGSDPMAKVNLIAG